MTAQDIIDALRAHYTPPEWAFFHELRGGTGYGKDADKRFDVWAMHMWGTLERFCFEIKISRSDFGREIRYPKKKSLGMAYSNRFYFVTPAGLVKPHEVPVNCGLIEVGPDGTLTEVVEAAYRETYPPAWTFVASILRRVDWLTINRFEARERKCMEARRLVRSLSERAYGYRKWNDKRPHEPITEAEFEEVRRLLDDAFDKFNPEG